MRHSTAFSYLTPQISTKTSNAASASFLLSAIQISCSARLAFDCWLFGSFQHIGGLVHPAALAAGRGPHFLDRLPEAERAISDRELGPDRKPASLQGEEQLLPGL